MKTTVNAAAFYKAMTALMTIPAKSSVKILQEIKVEFTKDRCTLSATNFDTWLSMSIPASGDSFAFVFWNSTAVQKVCRYFTGQLKLELFRQKELQVIIMRNGNKDCKSPVDEVGEYPTWPEFEAEQTYAVNAAKLLTCVKQVKYAVDPYSTRPEYRGILFQDRHIWALEGRRAGCCDGSGLDVKTPFMVGVPALEHLKVFGDCDIQIDVTENWITFRNECIRLTAHRVSNATPLIYEKIAPQNWKEEICFNRKDFVQALKYLLARTGKTDRPYVRFDNGTLTLRSTECCYKTEIPIAPQSSIVFNFNAKLMLDALMQFKKQKTVAMRLTSPLGAILLVAGNSSAIVLPVRLKEEQNAA